MILSDNLHRSIFVTQSRGGPFLLVRHFNFIGIHAVISLSPIAPQHANECQQSATVHPKMLDSNMHLFLTTGSMLEAKLFDFAFLSVCGWQSRVSILYRQSAKPGSGQLPSGEHKIGRWYAQIWQNDPMPILYNPAICRGSHTAVTLPIAETFGGFWLSSNHHNNVLVSSPEPGTMSLALAESLNCFSKTLHHAARLSIY